MTEYIYGKHAVTILLEKNSQQVMQIFVQQKATDERLKKIIALCDKRNISINYLPKLELSALADSEKHQGVVASLIEKKQNEYSLTQILATAENPLLLILDSVQDPHNLGACLRSAQAAGVDAVIVPKDNAAGLTATVRKVACGAAEQIPFIAVTNLARVLQDLQQQGVWLYGLDGSTTESIYEADFKRPMAIVMGAEDKGLRQLTKKYCDVLLRIPMPGEMESLNVSVATGITLFEAVRQRS